MTTSPATDREEPSIWSGPRAAVTVGLFALAFMVAFEALAVVTVMPLVAEDLDGLSLYAVAFAAPIAVSIFSRLAAAPWVDRRGPAPALRAGVAAFVLGLVLSGTAPTMTVFLLGRAVQGLGMGAIGVTLFVVVARSYPEALRPRAMTVMTSAWMLPAVVGPALAGWLAHLVGWRAVFWAAPVLALVSVALTWRSVAALGPGRRDADAADEPRRPSPGTAAAVAAAVLVLAIAGRRDVPAWPLLLAAAGAALVLLTPRIVLPGTWRGRRGIPSLMAARCLLAAAYFGAEAYVPLGLVRVRGLEVGTAGLALTAAAFAWFLGSWAVAHPERFGRLLATPGRRSAVGASAVAVGVGAGLLVLVLWVPTVVVALVWGVGGLGMGAAMSTTSVQVLAASTGIEAAHTAAMQTNDAIGESVWITVGTVVFAVLLPHGIETALVGVLGPCLAVALAGLLLLRRAA